MASSDADNASVERLAISCMYSETLVVSWRAEMIETESDMEIDEVVEIIDGMIRETTGERVEGMTEEITGETTEEMTGEMTRGTTEGMTEERIEKREEATEETKEKTGGTDITETMSRTSTDPEATNEKKGDLCERNPEKTENGKSAQALNGLKQRYPEQKTTTTSRPHPILNNNSSFGTVNRINCFYRFPLLLVQRDG